MTRHETKGNVTGRITIDCGRDWMQPEEEQIVVFSNHVWLKAEAYGKSGKFFCSEDGVNYTQVGMICQDLQFHRYPADFKNFSYKS